MFKNYLKYYFIYKPLFAFFLNPFIYHPQTTHYQLKNIHFLLGFWIPNFAPILFPSKFLTN